MGEDAYETWFGVLSLTTAELQSLKAEERNFLMASSFIMNDVRFYWSLMARSKIDDTTDDLRSMQVVRWLWCCRKLASVIHESDVALTKFISMLPFAQELSKKSPHLSRSNKASPAAKLAHELRNKSSYHYDANELAAALDGFALDTPHRLFAHPQSGNSLSEFGEQIHTLQKIKKAGAIGNDSEFERWIRECSSSIMRFCEKVTAAIITTAFPQKLLEERRFEIKHEAETADHRWPLFLVAPDKEEVGTAAKCWAKGS